MAVGKKSKPSYLYAIIGVSVVLFLLGVLGWLVINGQGLTREFKESITLTANFHDNTREEKIQEFKRMVDAQGFVKQSHVISKEEALKIATEMEGQDSQEFLGYNPFFASLELNVYQEYVTRDSLEKIRNFLLQSNIVREVTYPQVEVKQINYNFRKINIILGVIALILFIAVIILIDNTVRLAMFSNRFLIKTMQMVGATRYFISKPFDRRAVVNGLISAVIAVAGLLLIMKVAEDQYPELKNLRNNSSLGILIIGLILMGILISLISTHRSVVKYLKMHVDDLY